MEYSTLVEVAVVVIRAWLWLAWSPVRSGPSFGLTAPASTQGPGAMGSRCGGAMHPWLGFLSYHSRFVKRVLQGAEATHRMESTWSILTTSPSSFSCTPSFSIASCLFSVDPEASWLLPLPVLDRLIEECERAPRILWRLAFCHLRVCRAPGCGPQKQLSKAR